MDYRYGKMIKIWYWEKIVEDLGCFVWRRECLGRVENCFYTFGGCYVEEGLVFGCVVFRGSVRSSEWKV